MYVFKKTKKNLICASATVVKYNDTGEIVCNAKRYIPLNDKNLFTSVGEFKEALRTWYSTCINEMSSKIEELQDQIVDNKYSIYVPEIFEIDSKPTKNNAKHYKF